MTYRNATQLDSLACRVEWAKFCPKIDLIEFERDIRVKTVTKLGLLAFVAIGGVIAGRDLTNVYSEPTLIDEGVGYRAIAVHKSVFLSFSSPVATADFTQGRFDEICPIGYLLKLSHSKAKAPERGKGYKLPVGAKNDINSRLYGVAFDLYCWREEGVNPSRYVVEASIHRGENDLPLPLMIGNIKSLELKTTHLKQDKLRNPLTDTVFESRYDPIKVESGMTLVFPFKLGLQNTTASMPHYGHLFEDIEFDEFATQMSVLSALVVDGFGARFITFDERDANRASWGL
ncbi:hypothetical protein OTK49_03180 [Vibrio coralliirubri]|uniref:hypothetical protein n=1 Tax=Vibrio coralliirubri TaxID=1516159 RepID=UPI00228519AD|nr:hypothetical protein [Vibrio coralliirubri]MCY9861519.1 hypothetical protein [Vibrio coralliirubri]